MFVIAILFYVIWGFIVLRSKYVFYLTCRLVQYTVTWVILYMRECNVQINILEIVCVCNIATRYQICLIVWLSIEELHSAVV